MDFNQIFFVTLSIVAELVWIYQIILRHTDEKGKGYVSLAWYKGKYTPDGKIRIVHWVWTLFWLIIGLAAAGLLRLS